MMPNHRPTEAHRAPAPDADWGTLVARTVDDVTRIMQSEVRLFTASMRVVVEHESDRVILMMLTCGFAAIGALALIASLLLFLHEFEGLVWWQSFAVVGAAVMVMAAILASVALRQRRTTPASGSNSR